MALADKIKQLAQAVAGDVKTLQGEMSGKQPLSPTLTNTTASFTSTLLTKLNGIAAGATNTASPVQSDWNAGTGLAYIQNKPVFKTVNGAEITGTGNIATPNTTYAAGTGLGLSGSTFSVSYGTGTGTAAQGNDSRINNGQTAYGWGNHASAGYAASAALTSGLGQKVDKQTGYGLSQENYSTAEKTKLAGIATGATANTGTVTSVQASAPTGLTVSGGPITSTGTLVFSYAAGYSIPTNAKQTQWDAAYGYGNHATQGYATQVWVNDQIADIEGGDVTGPSASTNNAIPVFDDETGKVIRQTSATIDANGNLIVSPTTIGVAFLALNTGASGTGGGAGIVGGTTNEPLAVGHRLGYFLVRGGTTHAAGFEGLATEAWTGSGKGTKLSFLTTPNGSTARGVAFEIGQDKSATIHGAAQVNVIAERTANTGVTVDGVLIKDGLVDGRDVSVDGAKIDGLATVATSGAYADLSGKPTLSSVATSGSYSDLSNKPTIPAGTVTSVQVATPTGLSVSGGPVTTSGTLTISYASGYAIPTTTKQGQWDTAYGWGNHASAGYATTSALTSGLSGKVNTQAGYGLSQENYTLTEKNKLSGIASGATNTAAPVQSDWNASSGLAAIQNKPTIPTIPGVATTSANGLMSSGDKTKLNGAGTNAQGNKTISTEDPSGGSNGDIWMKV